MKTRTLRSLLSALACLAALSALGARAGTVTWTGSGANAQWGTTGNWNSGVPASGDDLVFGSGIGSGATIDLQGSESANSVTFGTTSGFILGTSGSQTLTLGANGTGNYSITSTLISGQTATINAALSLTGVNNWQLNSASTGGTLNVKGNISGATMINVTANSASGKETLALYDASNSYTGDWTFNGNATANDALVIAPQTTGAFGTGTLNFRGATTLNFIFLAPVDGTNQTIANNLDFTGTSSFNYFYSNNDTIQLTGNLSGAFTSGRLYFNANSGGVAGNATWIIGGAGSSSTFNPGSIQIDAGIVEMARAGAFGLSSQLVLGSGTTTATTATNPTLLWEVGETTGVTVTARGSNGTVNIGEGASNATLTFSSASKIALQNSSTAADGSNADLFAAAGSTFAVNGAVTDKVSSTHYNRAIVIGATGQTGAVTLGGSANDYAGGTVVGSGTTLLVANTTSTSSATGSGAVQVGYGAATVSGGATTSGSTVVTVGSTSGLFLGQTVSGTGIPAGSVITAINSATQIQVSQAATATASGLTLAAAAGTGILGGSGYIAPTGTAGVVVASGSSVFPGAGGGASATLVLNGAGTTGPLLTMQSGSTFTFNPGDKINLWNYAAGDLALNGNTVNFNNAQAGTYTLFDFYSDSGSTLTASGIASGLVLGSGLSGFTAALNYDADDITVTLLAAPEPGTAGLALVGAAALLLGWRRISAKPACLG